LGDSAGSFLAPLLSSWSGVCNESRSQSTDTGGRTGAGVREGSGGGSGAAAAEAYAWDALAASYILWPDLFQVQPVQLQIALESAAMGRLSAAPSPAQSSLSNAQAALEGAAPSAPPAESRRSLVLTGVDAAEWEHRVISLFRS
jgi:hypothetical protein